VWLAAAAMTPAGAAPMDATCTPIQVMDLGARIHVRCSAAVSGISYFALPTTDAPRAARTLSLMTSALIAGRNLTINYDPADQTGAAIGCQITDCRLIRAVGIQ
jgi:hypothetical protein